MRAAARTIAIVCGTTMSSPPVMSRTPSSDWVGRVVDRRGRAAPALDGSAEVLGADDVGRTGRGRRAMPGALVPASRSSQLLPSTKPMDSARRSMLGVPHTHSSCPAASETAITASQSRAAWPSTSSRRGKTWASGWASRWSRRASSGSVIGRLDPVGLDTGGRRAHPRVGDLGADGGQWIHRASMRVAGRPVQRRLTPAPDGQARRRGVGSTKRVSPATCGR